MRSFDETVTIEEMYDASDYLEWLIAQENERETTEADLHWERVRIELENESYLNRLKHEPSPF